MMNEINLPESVLKNLRGLFADGRQPHAVLVDGADEEKRLAAAFLVAKMSVCANKGQTPCGECEHCRKASENIHPDIITVSKPEDKKRFAKEDVKKLVSDAYLTPNEAAVKVFIIKEMQLMTEESQNVLLKILEEPPAYTAFVLTSAAANSVIGTVLSRVVRLRLGEVSAAEYSEKATAVVTRLVASLMSPYEYDRIEATAQMEGNKALTAEVLELFACVLRDAIALKSQGRALLKAFEEQSDRLSSGMSLGRLLEMYDTIDGLLRSLENNPNYTLLSTVLCASI